jgi:transcriptional regulator with XRE-family HTH domain
LAPLADPSETAFHLCNDTQDTPMELKTKGPVIGRYERDEMKPSIEAATKMAMILEVSLDWLVGNTDAELDTATLNRVQDISKLSQKDKELVFEFLDSFISNRKIKNVLQ